MSNTKKRKKKVTDQSNMKQVSILILFNPKYYRLFTKIIGALADDFFSAEPKVFADEVYELGFSPFFWVKQEEDQMNALIIKCRVPYELNESVSVTIVTPKNKEEELFSFHCLVQEESKRQRQRKEHEQLNNRHLLIIDWHNTQEIISNLIQFTVEPCLMLPNVKQIGLFAHSKSTTKYCNNLFASVMNEYGYKNVI